MKNIYKKIIIIVFALFAVVIIYDTLFKDNPLCNKGDKIKRTSGAMESLQFMSEARTFPDIDIPPVLVDGLLFYNLTFSHTAKQVFFEFDKPHNF